MRSARKQGHLLLVDDDTMLRGMAAKTLEHAGFQVTVAADGEEALERFQLGSFDLVLLDLVMPGLDGYEVCRRIRASSQGAKIPVLILTGRNDTESIELAYREGATDFITKPINWTLLSHRVRYALRSSVDAEAMRRSEESLARAQRIAGMGNWAVFPDGRIECSPQQFHIYGVDVDSDLRTFLASADSRVIATDRERVSVARSRMAQRGEPYQLEFQITRDDGAIRTLFEQAGPTVGGHSPGGVEGITQDITDRVQAAQRIRQLAHYDDITELPNRRFFIELATPALERARRVRSGCAVLHVDIDRFAGVNDAYGRARGDAVLKAIADRLRSLTRGGDLTAISRAQNEESVLARIGANAFTVLIVDLAGQEQAAAVAQRLLAAIEEPVDVGTPSERVPVVLTASIGIALFPGDAPDLAGLTRCAEQAVQVAKRSGRAQHRFFDEQINARAASRLVLEAELRQAIYTDQLVLYFQPKVDVRKGTIVGAEALVRWAHPDRGLLAPNRFIPLAEETGLIVPLTDWVLEAACRNLRAWSAAGLPDVPLSVNLAAPTLMDATLPDKLDRLMQRFGLSPRRLMLEMTETMLIHDVESVVTLLETLRARGYGLSLDDFGTGYSSLSYLKRFPIDELKIDRAFVTDVGRGGRDGALASAIIAMGRELGMKVVAEGVETAEQSLFLLNRECDLQQGFLFSKPVPHVEFERLLRAGSIDAAGVPPWLQPAPDAREARPASTCR